MDPIFHSVNFFPFLHWGWTEDDEHVAHQQDEVVPLTAATLVGNILLVVCRFGHQWCVLHTPLIIVLLVVRVLSVVRSEHATSTSATDGVPNT